MEKNNFVWNLIYLGVLIQKYAEMNPRLTIEWNFPNPDEDMNCLCLIMGTQEAHALEKAYLRYQDVERMDAPEFREMIINGLERMRQNV